LPNSESRPAAESPLLLPFPIGRAPFHSLRTFLEVVPLKMVLKKCKRASGSAARRKNNGCAAKLRSKNAAAGLLRIAYKVILALVSSPIGRV
jgi:hypothetical protein